MSYLNRIQAPPRRDSYVEFNRSRQHMLVAFFNCVSDGHLSAADAADEVLATFSAMRQLTCIGEKI